VDSVSNIEIAADSRPKRLHGKDSASGQRLAAGLISTLPSPAILFGCARGTIKDRSARAWISWQLLQLHWLLLQIKRQEALAS